MNAMGSSKSGGETKRRILASEAATEAEKILAGAVLRFEHKASVEDQSALERLAGQ